MKYKVNRIKSTNLNKFFNLLKKYNSKHLFLKNKSFFKWQYSNKNIYNGYIFSKLNKFSAFQLFVPYNKYDPSLTKSVFLTNFYSQGIHLAAGYIVFKKILKNLSPDFIGSSGIWNKNLLNYHHKLGFKTGEMNHFVMVSPYKKNFKILNFHTRKEKIKRNLSTKITNDLTNYKVITDKNLFKLSYKIKFDFTPIKSLKYINNRYLKHPEFKYHVYSFSKKNMSIKSMMVFRVLKNKSSSIIKIVEFFGEDKYIPDYYKLILSLLKNYKSEYISFYNFGVEKKIILKSGFNLIKDNIEVYPDLFNPLVKKNVVLNFAYKNFESRNVRLFLGDGDRDRPS
tara:strand:- start:368 stop:1384 length:1017 start_codon:yes stop_codon:yes gene_type:complete